MHGDAGDFARTRWDNVRGAARHVALSSLAMLARSRGDLERGLVRPRVHVLYLHAVHRRHETQFRALLSRLARTHRFIGYGEAVDCIRDGRIDRPLLAFSLDDGFKEQLSTVRILE